MSKQTELLICALEGRPDLVSGKLGGAYLTPADLKKGWEAVALDVNSCGLGKPRNGPEMKRKWVDLKHRIKAKAAALDRSRSLTGGGEEVKNELTSLEERAIQLMGNTCYRGIGVPTNDTSLRHLMTLPSQSIPDSVESKAQIKVKDIQILHCDANTPSSKSINKTSTPNLLEAATPRVHAFKRKRKLESDETVQELINLKKISNELKEKNLLELEKLTESVRSLSNGLIMLYAEQQKTNVLLTEILNK